MSRASSSPQVFINYSGTVRRNFVSHLEAAFNHDEIQCFGPRDSCMGDTIESFFQVIEKSKVALVIFTKGYSQSRWCLRELVKKMENVKENKVIVIPIFINVEVEDVRDMRGDFGRDLCIHLARSNMSKWKEALISVPSEAVANHMGDKYIIDNIVLSVKKILVSKGEETNMFTCKIISGTIEQPTRDHALHGGEQRLKQLEDMFVHIPTIGKTVAEMSFHIQLIHDRITHLNVQGLNDEAEMFTRKTDRKVSLPPQHQVFISFRGELRNNFISHLVGGLRRKKINVFIDKNEKKGEDIGHLLKRIEESRIAIVVFSRKYTDATWCLREAEKIQERAAQGKLKVIPIFYKVTPENVKLISGEFGDNFRDYRRKHQNEKSVNKKRKEALKLIGGKIGFVLNDQSDEKESIASIVKEVLQMLTSIPFATQIVQSHVNQFSYKGETSKNAFGGISINELSNHCYSSTAQSDMHMSGFANSFNVGPNQSNYTPDDNSFPGPWRTMTTSRHYQPTNRSWGEFSDESSDDNSGQREPYILAKQLDAVRYKKKMD